MKRLIQLLAAVLLCSLIACNANNANDKAGNEALVINKDANENAVMRMGTLAADSSGAPAQTSPKPAASSSNLQAKIDWDKKIIKTGHIVLEVKSYTAFNELLHTRVDQLGGYIAQEDQNETYDRIENIVTLKVPVEQFGNALTQLTPTAEKTVEKKITTEDVTGEIVDVKSRMEAKKRVRDRYLDLLKQAQNMEEVLQVQHEVNDIQEHIEAAAGRIGYLSHAAAFSTINIRFYQVLPAIVNDPTPSYGSRLLESFKNGLHWFAELMVVMVSLWPLWTGILIGWLLIRKRMRFAGVKKSEAASVKG